VAYDDPQSVTIAGVTTDLPRISSGENNGVFQNGDATIRLSVSHLYKNRTRRQLRIDLNKIAPDVFTSDNVAYNCFAYVVVDAPKTGFTVAEQKELVDGLLAYLRASSGAAVTKLLGGEN